MTNLASATTLVYQARPFAERKAPPCEDEAPSSEAPLVGQTIGVPKWNGMEWDSSISGQLERVFQPQGVHLFIIPKLL